MSILEFEGVRKTYRVGEQEIHALAGIDLRIEEGEFVAIIGPSGSGKSTLIDALAAAVRKGIVVVAASQCLRGTVNLGAYALGQRLQDIGVVSCGDMTTEAIAAKLALLLAQPGATPAAVRAALSRRWQS